MNTAEQLRHLAAKSNDGDLRGPALQAAVIIVKQGERIAELEAALEIAREDALREAAELVGPKSEEPSVDPSNPGDIQTHAYWFADESAKEAILHLITKEPKP